jgi:hypothetical protein
VRCARPWVCPTRFSELVLAQTAIHRNDRTRNGLGQGRGQEHHQVSQLFRLAIAPHRDLVVRLPLSILGRVVAENLLGVDAAGRNAVDRHTVFAHHTRQALGPRVDARFGAKRAIGVRWLAFASDVDNAAPIARHHPIDQRVSHLARAVLSLIFKSMAFFRRVLMLDICIVWCLHGRYGVVITDVPRVAADHRLRLALRKSLLRRTANDLA